ncbi:iron compound ABC transporter, ATP-binding protein [Hyphomonas neptunium ATCC 15444]|uniref:Iron compound ABC transporter, ATP-binding protein n=2 Tax=Hyphomonas TaxID=85 RepID=Q0C329_HYPNA|nr:MULTISPECIES: ABC transporter ATP-binding protein [Hyphomonas]ABI75968.1 iron compound ABC transporter, ATP-binding protein [Hyphomonas neptunium ATCC 15444]KCZ95899.1 iron compound ABC transporter ATP-binding protein [Hyphomonas hirschiana VP5]
MISAEHLTVALNGRDVARDVSFWLRDGELAALVGPNGAGKSSVLKALAGVTPSAGEVRICDAPADKLTVRERARRLAWLPQTRPVAWNLLAEDVVALGRFAGAPAPFDRMGEADRAAVVAALEKADATHLIGRSFQALSGGEQARVHLARLLASPAPVLLLDEPCAALDIAHQLSLMAALAAEAAAGRTVIVVLHDLELAARFCPRVLVMQAGELVADGAPDAALSAEVLGQVFGVRKSAEGRLERANP